MVGWCGCGAAAREALWRLIRYTCEEADRGRLSGRRLCRAIGRGGWPGGRRLRAAAATRLQTTGQAMPSFSHLANQSRSSELQKSLEEFESDGASLLQAAARTRHHLLSPAAASVLRSLAYDVSAECLPLAKLFAALAAVLSCAVAVGLGSTAAMLEADARGSSLRTTHRSGMKAQAGEEDSLCANLLVRRWRLEPYAVNYAAPAEGTTRLPGEEAPPPPVGGGGEAIVKVIRVHAAAVLAILAAGGRLRPLPLTSRAWVKAASGAGGPVAVSLDDVPRPAVIIEPWQPSHTASQPAAAAGTAAIARCGWPPAAETLFRELVNTVERGNAPAGGWAPLRLAGALGSVGEAGYVTGYGAELVLPSCSHCRLELLVVRVCSVAYGGHGHSRPRHHLTAEGLLVCHLTPQQAARAARKSQPAAAPGRGKAARSPQRQAKHGSPQRKAGGDGGGGGGSSYHFLLPPALAIDWAAAVSAGQALGGAAAGPPATPGPAGQRGAVLNDGTVVDRLWEVLDPAAPAGRFLVGEGFTPDNVPEAPAEVGRVDHGGGHFTFVRLSPTVRSAKPAYEEMLRQGKAHPLTGKKGGQQTAVQAATVWLADPLVRFAAPKMSPSQRVRASQIETAHAAAAGKTRRLRLSVYVLEAKGLPKMDKWGKADPFTLVRIIKPQMSEPLAALGGGGSRAGLDRTAAVQLSNTGGTVTVKLLAGKDLLPADSGLQSDPYVILRLKGLKPSADTAIARAKAEKTGSGTWAYFGKPVRSQTHAGTLDPVFDQSFALALPATCPGSADSSAVGVVRWAVELVVKDADTLGRDDFIGGAVVELDSAGVFAARLQPAKVGVAGAGGLVAQSVSMTARLLIDGAGPGSDQKQPVSEKLLAKAAKDSNNRRGVVDKATGQVDLGTLSLAISFDPQKPPAEPLPPPAEDGLQRKTEVVKNTLDPDWSEMIEVSLPAPGLGKDGLQIACVVLDWDRVGSDTPIGQLVLPLSAVTNAGPAGFGGWFKLAPTAGGPDNLPAGGLGELKLQCTAESVPPTAADAAREAEALYAAIAAEIFFPIELEVLCAQPSPAPPLGSTVIVQYSTVTGTTATGTAVAGPQFVETKGAVGTNFASRVFQLYITPASALLQLPHRSCSVSHRLTNLHQLRFELRPDRPPVQLQRIKLKLLADSGRELTAAAAGMDAGQDDADEFFTVQLGLVAAASPAEVEARPAQEPRAVLHPSARTATNVVVLPVGEHPPARPEQAAVVERETAWVGRAAAERWCPWAGAVDHVCNRCGMVSVPHLDGTLWPACLSEHGPPADFVLRPVADGLRTASLLLADRFHQIGWLSRPVAAV